MKLKLTKRSLDALQPSDRRAYAYDTELPGFGVAILPGGGRSFFVQYRTAGGRRGSARRVKLGDYGALTVDEARTLARKTLAAVAQGEDPSQQRAAAKAAPTVSELGEQFLDAVDARRKASTAREYRRLWDRRIKPALGSSKVAAVTTKDIETLHRSLRAKPYAGNRVLALLSVFFNFAERHHARPRHSNPTEDVEKFTERGRERFLSDEELARLEAALEMAERTGVPPAPSRRRKPAKAKTAKHRPHSADTPKPANPLAIAALRLLCYTGWRVSEVRKLQWSEVDIPNQAVLLADSKTGRSARPLNVVATAILSGLPRIDGTPFVFPGRDPSRPIADLDRIWLAVRHAAGLDDVRLHDLRHSFASMAARGGQSMLMLKSLLGHSDIRMTQRYAHLAKDPIREAANATANAIAAAMRGTDTSAVTATVTPIRSRRRRSR